MAKVSYDPLRMGNSTAIYLASSPRQVEAVIPESRLIDADIPPRARRYLEQAINSIAAPDGAIMLAGSAVDAMLKVSGYTDGSIYKRIEAAVSDNIITPAMRDWAHAVRLESNKPRHADLDEPHSTPEMASQMISFAEALGEYLFSLPSRVARGREAASTETDTSS